MSSKYAVHTIVVVVSFLVTTTNIAASGAVPTAFEDGQEQSIIVRLTQPDTEQLFIEEADTVIFAQDVSYLGNNVVTTQEYYATESSFTGTDTGDFDDALDEEFIESHIDNAVRAAPDAGTDTARTRTKPTEHVVKEGESIGAIARTYGLSTQTLLGSNDLSARSIIRPGQTLTILPVDGITYAVKRGDTLGAIAKKYETNIQDVMDFNGLLDPSELKIGDEILLPGGKLPPPPPPPKPTRISNDIRNVFTPPPAADPDTGTRMLWPAGVRRISQYYKWGHAGVDIAGPIGTAIYAADDGVVVVSGWNSGGYGNMIVVDHGNGLSSRYAHATKNLVQKGDVVKRGDVIALMGSTGRSTGPHLHFEVMRGGIYNRVNPFDYIQ